MIFFSVFSLVPTQFIFLCKHRVSLRCSSSYFIHHWLSHSRLHLKTYLGFISASFSLKITLFDPYWPLTKFFNSFESASIWKSLLITLKTVLAFDVKFVISSLQHLHLLNLGRFYTVKEEPVSVSFVKRTKNMMAGGGKKRKKYQISPFFRPNK